MNKLKNLAALLLIAVFAFSCEKEMLTPDQNQPALQADHEEIVRPDQQCGTSRYGNMVNKTSDVRGTVEVLNDADNLYILVQMNLGHFLDHAKVFIGSGSDLEVDVDGNVNLEESQYQTIYTPSVSSVTITIPLGSISDCQEIVFFSQASQRNFFGNVISTEEIWLDGLALGNGSKFKYCIGTCLP